MIREALEAYKVYLQKQPISPLTRSSYQQRVSKFLQWLETSPDGSAALNDQIERDFHLREFKARMLQQKTSPSTVNGILCAVDNFYLSRNMEAAKVKRLELPKQAPRALNQEEEKHLRKALLRTTIRNRTLILLLWNTGLRISEIAALNVGDLTLTARTGQVIVCCGKGLKQRIVPLNAESREAIQSYLCKTPGRGDHEPLFVSQKKSRLSIASIDRIVRQIGAIANIELSCHDLRHSFISSLVRSNTDLVLIAEISGHSQIETLRRYSMPTEAEKQAVVEKLVSHAS